LMATAVPAGLAAAYTEKKALQHTISLPPRNPNHQYREAQIQVAEALTAGTTTAVLLITGGILKYRAARKARQES
ncbi:MAG TPA: hypothetical protein VFJ84_01380, partial [Candidatus Saccharimonadales bacterium]|nr:hypothetical protein [Candidatus Saccharimonadales bacterium]